jgi:hypothetical protein
MKQIGRGREEGCCLGKVQTRLADCYESRGLVGRSSCGLMIYHVPRWDFFSITKMHTPTKNTYLCAVLVVFPVDSTHNRTRSGRCRLLQLLQGLDGHHFSRQIVSRGGRMETAIWRGCEGASLNIPFQSKLSTTRFSGRRWRDNCCMVGAAAALRSSFSTVFRL